MNKADQKFSSHILSATSDIELHQNRKVAKSAYFSKQEKSNIQFKNIEVTKQYAAVRKWKATENLDKYLIEFEANFIKNGGKVLWARDKEEAQKEIGTVLKKNFSKEVYYACSELGDEIQLSEKLNKEEIKSVSLNETVALTSTVIAEASYIIADPGAIALMDYTGKLQQATSKARCIIAIASITDVLHHLIDLNLFIPLTSSYTKGETINRSTSLLFGSRKADETEGVQELYLLLIDNGRSNILADEKARQTARCIKCGACAKVCPVSNTIGELDEVYESPINAIQIPILKGYEEHKHLAQASTLCGVCTEVCPVNINLHELFIHNRKQIVNRQLNSQKEKWFYLLWKKTMLKRDKYSLGSFNSNKIVMESVYEKVWGTKESRPSFAKKSFNEMWKERT